MIDIGNPTEVPDKLYIVKDTLSNSYRTLILKRSGPPIVDWGNLIWDRMPAQHTVPNLCPEPFVSRQGFF